MAANKKTTPPKKAKNTTGLTGYTYKAGADLVKTIK